MCPGYCFFFRWFSPVITASSPSLLIRKDHFFCFFTFYWHIVGNSYIMRKRRVLFYRKDTWYAERFCPSPLCPLHRLVRLHRCSAIPRRKRFVPGQRGTLCHGSAGAGRFWNCHMIFTGIADPRKTYSTSKKSTCRKIRKGRSSPLWLFWTRTPCWAACTKPPTAFLRIRVLRQWAALIWKQANGKSWLPHRTEPPILS